MTCCALHAHSRGHTTQGETLGLVPWVSLQCIVLGMVSLAYVLIAAMSYLETRHRQVAVYLELVAVDEQCNGLLHVCHG